MHRNLFSIERMCHLLSVSRSSYYAWVKRVPSKRCQEISELCKKIREVYDDSKGRYGSPKIALSLQSQGMKVSKQRVGRWMCRMGLRSITRKKFRVTTTDSNHHYKVCANHLNRNFTVDGPCKVWTSDLTYIPTREGWLYLTVVMDLFDRRIVGWSMSEDMQCSSTVVPSFQMAVHHRGIKGGLIFHSDRGSQYACTKFRDMLSSYEVLQSMSGKGDCWDNSVTESFFKILKSEMVWHRDFSSREEAKREVFEFIEVWYNRNRIHGSLGFLSPSDYYAAYLKSAA